MSSHAVMLTAIYSKGEKFAIVTVEMWNLLDSQANHLEKSKFKSIVTYQFSNDKLIYRSSDEENQYIKSDSIQEYLSKFMELNSNKTASVKLEGGE